MLLLSAPHTSTRCPSRTHQLLSAFNTKCFFSTRPTRGRSSLPVYFSVGYTSYSPIHACLFIVAIMQNSPDLQTSEFRPGCLMDLEAALSWRQTSSSFYMLQYNPSLTPRRFPILARPRSGLFRSTILSCTTFFASMSYVLLLLILLSFSKSQELCPACLRGVCLLSSLLEDVCRVTAHP